MPWSEPDDDQLARFVHVTVRPTVPLDQIKDGLAASPELRAHWLEQHRRMQAAADEVELLVGEGMDREEAGALTVEELAARHDAR